jgi:hypothetical protein
MLHVSSARDHVLKLKEDIIVLNETSAQNARFGYKSEVSILR